MIDDPIALVLRLLLLGLAAIPVTAVIGAVAVTMDQPGADRGTENKRANTGPVDLKAKGRWGIWPGARSQDSRLLRG